MSTDNLTPEVAAAMVRLSHANDHPDGPFGVLDDLRFLWAEVWGEGRPMPTGNLDETLTELRVGLSAKYGPETDGVDGDGTTELMTVFAAARRFSVAVAEHINDPRFSAALNEIGRVNIEVIHAMSSLLRTVREASPHLRQPPTGQ